MNEEYETINLNRYDYDNSVTPSYPYLCTKYTILSYKILKQLAFIITGAILYYKYFDIDCHFISQIPLLIILNGILILYSIIDNLFSLNNIGCIRFNLKRIINLSITMIYCFLSIYLFLYPIGNNDCKDRELDPITNLLISYIIIEIFIPTIFALCLVSIIFCGIRMCCPHYLISIANNNLPIRLGASDNELNKLKVYKFNPATPHGPSAGNLLVNISENSNTIEIKEEDALCGICMDKYDSDKPIVKLTCDHHFHKECCFEWLKINKTCPLCRANVLFDII